MRNEAEKLSQLDERLKAKIQNEYIVYIFVSLGTNRRKSKQIRRGFSLIFNEDNEGNDEIKGNRLALQARVQPNNDDAEIFNDLDINNEDFVSENESSILENLENLLATTYRVVSLFDRQFPYMKELYNTFPNKIRTLENEWGKVEANLKKIIEERWNVSKTKQLVFHNKSALFYKDASELRYRSEIVNLLLAGAFEMTERSIWLKTGEIENEIQKCKGMILRRILMSGQNSE
ncbi:hypothetical protein RhiirA4_467993 [Rhizophagus irregularis]|uniref:Uncharacterized protein n=1 Tax=Rhizophagus irregularis TaxID=588596 RepID=A0A2I1GWY9_9GLOM|nr:hypothetical protein RhiirA4_467993 [Rhizophagus irregularis]